MSQNFDDLTKLEKQGLIAASLTLSFGLAMKQVGDKIMAETTEDTMSDFEKGKLAIIVAAMDQLQTQITHCSELYLLTGFTILEEWDMKGRPDDEFNNGMAEMLEEMGVVERFKDAKMELEGGQD